MWIKCLRMRDFQKHTNLTLDFVPGVNYIYGSSDAGKSCVRRAIGFVFFGDPRNDDIRKEGTKQTSVTAILDDGTEVERIKSATINRYNIRKNGTEVTYDSIGASIPEDIQKILQVATIEIDKETLNLNIAEQISLPFLLDKSGSFRLKIFNKLTGNDLLDKVLQGFNKDILGVGRDIKVEQEFIDTNTPLLEEVTKQVEVKVLLLDNFKLKRENILAKVETYNKLITAQDKVQVLHYSLDQTEINLKGIKIVDDEKISKIHEDIDKWIILDDLKGALLESQVNIDKNKNELKALKLVEIDTEGIKGKINQVEALKNTQKKLLEAHRGIISTQDAIGVESLKIVDLEGKYVLLLKSSGVCPVCRQDVSKCEVHL